MPITIERTITGFLQLPDDNLATIENVTINVPKTRTDEDLQQLTEIIAKFPLMRNTTVLKVHVMDKYPGEHYEEDDVAFPIFQELCKLSRLTNVELPTNSIDDGDFLDQLLNVMKEAKLSKELNIDFANKVLKECGLSEKWELIFNFIKQYDITSLKVERATLKDELATTWIKHLKTSPLEILFLDCFVHDGFLDEIMDILPETNILILSVKSNILMKDHDFTQQIKQSNLIACKLPVYQDSDDDDGILDRGPEESLGYLAANLRNYRIDSQGVDPKIIEEIRTVMGDDFIDIV